MATTIIVAKSVDNGVTWQDAITGVDIDSVLSDGVAGSGPKTYNIACDPTNADRAAFISEGDVDPLFVTRDGGLTWEQHAIPSDLAVELVNVPLLVWGTGGRVIVYQSNGNILYTDDFGATWVVADTTSSIEPEELIRGGDTGPFFATRINNDESGSPQACIGRSIDGASWEWFIDPASVATGGSGEHSIAYDVLLDVLYVAYYGGASIVALNNASAVSVDEANAALQAAADAEQDIMNEGVSPYWSALPIMANATYVNGNRSLVLAKKQVTVTTPD